MKITAVLMVAEVGHSLPFWVDRMGFDKQVEVPDGDRIGFVILTCGGAEVMLQSVESVRKDVETFAPAGDSKNAAIFIEVDDFADTLKRLEGYPIAMAERTTFYGTREVGVFEPNGHPVIFARHT